MAGTSPRAIIYTRISKDKAGDAHGVANQLAECERYAAARAWQVVARLSDNDLSASNGRHRPGYEAALDMVKTGQSDVVLCWRLDRFVRRVIDLEAVISLFESAGATLAAVSGDIDLGTGPGRMVGRMLSVIAQGEVEQKGERQRLAAQAAARAGKRWAGGHRPFGYQADHVTPYEPEAAVIRWAADALLGGSTVSAVAREWNRLGFASAQGGRAFSRSAVGTIMRNPRLAGISVYRGEVVGAGDWKPLLAEETWRAVMALLDDPGRKPPRGVKTLIGGLARCACGNVIAGCPTSKGAAGYRCRQETRGGRPGPHATLRAAAVDQYITAVITERLTRPDLADLLHPPPGTDVAGLRREAASIRRRLDAMAGDWAVGLLSRAQLTTATQRGNVRLAEIQAALETAGGKSVLAPFAAGSLATEVWARLDLARQRAVIDALCRITLLPAGQGARKFNPETVQIVWRTA